MGDCYITRRGGNAGGGKGLPEFTYDNGVCQLINDEGGNWRIKFLTSGTLTFTNLGSGKNGIDVFLVGGGGACGYSLNSADNLGSGGGGYTRTLRGLVIEENKAYQITVGDGGNRPSSNNTQTRGGTSSAFALTAAGGYSGLNISGGKGGSGGAGSNSTVGGTDGGDGGGPGGTGQGTTTREFGEETGTLYASGGYFGSGNGEDNTGDGGGGVPQSAAATKGGSGIVIVRNNRPYPVEITQQPQDATAAENANAVFTVTATGTGLTYQWQFLPAGGGQWSDTSATGATTSQLTIQALSYRNGYKYRCVITDSNGNQVTSAEATLTVS